jgi:hypothetical protein
MREALQNAPEKFIRNCCLASLVPTFPLELMQWTLHKDQWLQGQKYFQAFYKVGLVEPEMEMGGQWYRLHRDLRALFQRRMRREGIAGYRNDYLGFLDRL